MKLRDNRTLSDRLTAVAVMTADAVRELSKETGRRDIRVADIGTDHGYLPIYLIEQRIVPRVIAMDVNSGPLERARKNVEDAGLAERIELRLSDGFHALSSGEAQVAVLSGMGGRLMKKLLTAVSPSTIGIGQLILQPQSEARELWMFLNENGWKVIDERMVYEDEQFYTMMRAVREGQDPGHGEEDFGAVLSNCRDETWHLFLEKEQAANAKLIERIAAQNGPQKRIDELTAEQANIEAALSVFRD
ncbi:MAG: class I SAM-dependent methyltransferase [Lachnospiraceae bacterium]|nr:class I SAM-dependent methyltransferase [Lachnospiraceae bacterium]